MVLLYEINTRVWIFELREKYGSSINLGNIPEIELDEISKYFDWIWFMGIWDHSKIDEKFIEIFIDENNEDEFIFDQDFTSNSHKNSPGWHRLKNNFKKNEGENIKTISYTENYTNFTVGETVKHENFGAGKIIHIDGNKLLINFKAEGEKKVIDKYVSKVINE